MNLIFKLSKSTCTFWLALVLCGGTAAGQSGLQSPQSSVDAVMQRVLSRCHSVTPDGIEEVSWTPPTKQDILEIKNLGDEAVMSLAKYVEADKIDGFAELFAVKFLIVIGTPLTFRPLILALGSEHWEVTRAQALSGLYQLSSDKAKQYILVAMNDKSELVRTRARDLFHLYPPEPQPTDRHD